MVEIDREGVKRGSRFWPTLSIRVWHQSTVLRVSLNLEESSVPSSKRVNMCQG